MINVILSSGIARTVRALVIRVFADESIEKRLISQTPFEGGVQKRVLSTFSHASMTCAMV